MLRSLRKGSTIVKIVVIGIIGIVIIGVLKGIKSAKASGNGVVPDPSSLASGLAAPPPPKTTVTTGPDKVKAKLLLSKDERAKLNQFQSDREAEYVKGIAKDFVSFNYAGVVEKTLNFGDLKKQEREEDLQLLIKQAVEGSPTARLTLSLRYPDIAKANGVYSISDKQGPKTVYTGGDRKSESSYN